MKTIANCKPFIQPSSFEWVIFAGGWPLFAVPKCGSCGQGITNPRAGLLVYRESENKFYAFHKGACDAFSGLQDCGVWVSLSDAFQWLAELRDDQRLAADRAGLESIQ